MPVLRRPSEPAAVTGEVKSARFSMSGDATNQVRARKLRQITLLKSESRRRVLNSQIQLAISRLTLPVNNDEGDVIFLQAA
jgi:hypothetical protein